MKIVIGNAGAKGDGHQVKIDLDTLIPTRALIQANSGGGKSFLLRRLSEQMFGKVQTILIDPEGEFATLREKFDYVLVGQGGETPADVRSAGMLAEKLLELKASAVCDLYESFRARPMDRRQWVRVFLNALLDAPRKLWHPLIVIVDEAHKFCPQETPKAASMVEREIISGCKEAMIALATTGRKRGFCPVWATQRLAKLDKDASAEMFNRLVGMTIEDVDVDRAADLMSVSKEQKNEFRQSLRTLQPGQFYAFGRAIAIERVLVKVGEVQTTHPESGSAKHTEPPPAPEAIRALLPQLADLPKEAEEKSRNIEDLQREVSKLKRELAKKAPAVETRHVASPDPRAIAAAVRKRDQDWAKAVGDYRSKLQNRIGEASRIYASTAKDVPFIRPDEFTIEIAVPGGPPARPVYPIPPAASTSSTKSTPSTAPITRSPDHARSPDLNEKLPPGERAVLIAAAQYAEGVERDQLSVLTGYKRSSRDAYIFRAIQKGFLEQQGYRLKATEAGIAALGSDYEPLPTGDELRDYWFQRLPAGEKKVLEVLVQRYPEAVQREEIDQHTGFARSSRDAYLQRLGSRRLVETVGRSEVKASEVLFG